MSESIGATIWRERNYADEQARPIIHIRITTDAIPGSVVAVPVSPERARTIDRWVALPDGTIDLAYEGRALEILIHPQDWYSLLTEKSAVLGYIVQSGTGAGEPDRVFGIPVSKS